MHIPHHTAPNKHTLHRRQMRILQFLHDLHILQFDVEELIDGLEGAAEGDVVFELDSYFGVDEGFEETVLRLLVWLTVQELGEVLRAEGVAGQAG